MGSPRPATKSPILLNPGGGVDICFPFGEILFEDGGFASAPIHQVFALDGKPCDVEVGPGRAFIGRGQRRPKGLF